MKALIIFALVLLSFEKSAICDCIMYPIETYTDRVDYIFVGRVIKVWDDKPGESLKGFKARVQVVERLKDGLIKADTLNFTSEFSNCDPSYRLQESYLFFANQASGDSLQMTHCTYWDVLARSEDNIRKLRIKLRK